MGRPAINTVFNNTNAEKEAANRLRPSDDRSFDRDNVIATMTAIDHVLEVNAAPNYTAAEIRGIANVLTPDTLTIKLGLNAGFLNGRRLSDDVINAEFSLLTHGNVTSDGVNANDCDVPGHVPLPRRTALTDPRPGPATGRSGTHHSSARPNAGTHRHMTTLSRHLTGLPRVPLAVLLLTVAMALVAQVLPRGRPCPGRRRHPRSRPMTPIPRRTAGPRPSTRSRPPVRRRDRCRPRAGSAPTSRSGVTGSPPSPRDFVSATRLAGSEIELARATGDIGAYLAADAAVDGALKAYPDYPLGARLPRRHPGRAPPLRGRPGQRRGDPGRQPDDATAHRDPRRRDARARRRGRRGEGLRPAHRPSTTRPPPASGSATSPSSRAGPPTPSALPRGPRRGQGRGRGRQRPRLVRLPAGRHADRHRRPDRSGRGLRRAPSRPTRASHLAHWGLGRASPPPTAGSTTRSRSLDRRSPSSRCPSSWHAAPTSTACAPPRRCPARGRRPQDGPGDRPAGGHDANVYDRTLSLYLAGSGDRSGPCPRARPGRDRGPQGRLRVRCARLGTAGQRPPGGGRCRDDHRARVRDARREAALPRRHDRRRRRRPDPRPDAPDRRARAGRRASTRWRPRWRASQLAALR